MNKGTTIKLMAALAASLALQVQAQSVDTRFSEAADTSWANAANWDLGVPGTTDSARLQNIAVADIDSAEEIGALNLRGNATLGATVVNVNDGGSLYANGDANTVLNGENKVGATANGDATLNINSGGSATFDGSDTFTMGRDGAVGYVNVDSNATLTVNQAVRIGDNAGSGGIITVNEGGTFTATNGVSLGAAAATFGSLVVNGGDVTFESVAGYVGYAGTGTVTIASGTLDAARLMLAYNSGASVGTLNMSGGTLTHTTQTMLVGRKGTGTFNLSGGTTAIKELQIGTQGGEGFVNLSGGSSNIVAGAIILGRISGSDGTLTITDENTYSKSSRLYLGQSAGATGTLVMNGGYLISSRLYLGENGETGTDSSIVLNDGLLQISALYADDNPADESLLIQGGVFMVRHIDTTNHVLLVEDLIASGVITWTDGVLGTGRDPDTATRSYTNGLGKILWADGSGSHYTYYWADAPQPVPTFSDWSDDFNLSTNENGHADNPDGDSFDNLAEYGLGGNPTNANDIGLFSVGSELDSGTNWFIYVYNRRTDAVDRGLTYEVLNKENLVIGTWESDYELAIGVSDPFIGSLGDGFESVTNRIPMDGQIKEFTKLEISISE